MYNILSLMAYILCLKCNFIITLNKNDYNELSVAFNSIMKTY